MIARFRDWVRRGIWIIPRGFTLLSGIFPKRRDFCGQVMA